MCVSRKVLSSFRLFLGATVCEGFLRSAVFCFHLYLCPLVPFCLFPLLLDFGLHPVGGIDVMEIMSFNVTLQVLHLQYFVVYRSSIFLFAAGKPINLKGSVNCKQYLS
jgi:hypothetical protein